MKYLNRCCRNSNLNKKLRFLYQIKQEVNNSCLDDQAKKSLMHQCDCEINRAWRLYGTPGYECTSGK